MTEPPATWTKSDSFATDVDSAKGSLDELLATLRGMSWDEQSLFAVHLAVEEALMNAIKHGNQYDRAKQVDVHYQASIREVFIRIRDEGPGFNPEEVPDPTADENLDATSGRGLMLMRSFMTSVEHNTEGNQVTMIKTRQSQGNPDDE